MKKVLLIGIGVLLVLIIAGVLATSLFLDKAVKKGVETVGPKMTKVDVKLDAVNLSLFSGSGKLKGLFVGNPEGYKSPSAIRVGTASLALQPKSVFADKIIINSIVVENPELTFETDLKGNNLSKILSNVEESMGGSGKEPPVESQDKKASRKMQVNEFVMTGGKINVSVAALGTSKNVAVPLPEIRLKDLGTGPEGITAAELTRQVLHVVLNKAVESAGKAASDLAKGALNDVTGSAQKAAGDAINKSLGEGLGGLLKKKGK